MSDAGIDLSFGPDTVEPSTYDPLPEGIYPMFVSNVEVKMTRAGEQMIVLEWTVTGDVRSGSKIMNDNLVIPGAQRKQNEPDKWNQMMNMLRDRLEAITGKEWREDNMKLNPVVDLSGATIKAIVVQNPYDYVQESTGERKVGVGNSIKKYLRPDDVTTQFVPQQQPVGVPQEASQTSPQSTGQSGGFAI